MANIIIPKEKLYALRANKDGTVSKVEMKSNRDNHKIAGNWQKHVAESIRKTARYEDKHK